MGLRNFVVGLVAVAWAASAHAQVQADGSYAMTGNAAIDLSLAVVNMMNKEVKDQQDMQQVFINRKKLELALDARLKELKTHEDKLTKLRSDVLTESNKLAKGAAAQKRAAGGDKAQEKAIDDAMAQRQAELKKAADQLDSAEKALKDTHGFAQQMRNTLHAIGDKSDKQALADWDGGLRHNYTLQQEKLKGRLDVFAASVATAATELRKTSSAAPASESVGALQVRVLSVGGKKTEFYVDGRKVSAGDTVALGSDNKLQMRAQLVDPRRKQSREIKSSGTVTVTANTDYALSYHAGKLASDWKVSAESYEWKEPSTRTGAKLVPMRSSSSAIPKNDTLEITFPGDTASEVIRGYVRGEIDWKKNGGSSETDSEDVPYELAIEPRR